MSHNNFRNPLKAAIITFPVANSGWIISMSMEQSNVVSASFAAEPGAELTTERHQVQFDSSTGNDEVVDIDAELAGLGASTADSVMPSEPEQGSRASNTTITFSIYEQNQWKVTNVLRVNPSRPLEFRRTGRRKDTSNGVWFCMT